MNGCDNAVEYMYQYIDDELTPSRRARIKQHLRRCNRCPDAFEFERQLKARIREAGRPLPPDHVLKNLRDLIAHERGKGSPDC